MIFHGLATESHTPKGLPLRITTSASLTAYPRFSDDHQLQPMDDNVCPDAISIHACQLDMTCSFTMLQTLSGKREPYELRSRLKSGIAKSAPEVERFVA